MAKHIILKYILATNKNCMLVNINNIAITIGDVITTATNSPTTILIIDISKPILYSNIIE